MRLSHAITQFGLASSSYVCSGNCIAQHCITWCLVYRNNTVYWDENSCKRRKYALSKYLRFRSWISTSHHAFCWRSTVLPSCVDELASTQQAWMIESSKLACIASWSPSLVDSHMPRHSKNVFVYFYGLGQMPRPRDNRRGTCILHLNPTMNHTHTLPFH